MQFDTLNKFAVRAGNTDRCKSIHIVGDHKVTTANVRTKDARARLQCCIAALEAGTVPIDPFQHEAAA